MIYAFTYWVGVKVGFRNGYAKCVEDALRIIASIKEEE